MYLPSMMVVPGLAIWRMKPLLDTMPPLRLISVKVLMVSDVIQCCVHDKIWRVRTIPVQGRAKRSGHGDQPDMLVSSSALPDGQVIGCRARHLSWMLRCGCICMLGVLRSSVIFSFHACESAGSLSD